METKLSEAWLNYFMCLDLAYYEGWDMFLTERQRKQAKDRADYYRYKIIYFNLVGIV